MIERTETTLARNTLRQIFSVDEDGYERLKLALYIDDMKKKILGNANTIQDNAARLNFYMELNYLFEPYLERCRDCFADMLYREQNDECVDEVFELGQWLKEQENDVRNSSAKKVRIEPIKPVPFERIHETTKADRLQDAFDLLKGRFVDSKCTLPQFRKIFRTVESHNKKKVVGSELESFNKVRWTGTVAELKYFIAQLIELKKVKNVKSKWATTVYCFECKTKSGDQINKNMFLSNSTKPKLTNTDLLDKAVAFF